MATAEGRASRSFEYKDRRFTRGRRYTVDMADDGMVGLFKGGYLVAVEADDGQVDSWGTGAVSADRVDSDVSGDTPGATGAAEVDDGADSVEPAPGRSNPTTFGASLGAKNGTASADVSQAPGS